MEVIVFENGEIYIHGKKIATIPKDDVKTYIEKIRKYTSTVSKSYQKYTFIIPQQNINKVLELLKKTESKKYTKSELMHMKKAELIQICKEMGLDTSGTKAELIKRILNAQ